MRRRKRFKIKKPFYKKKGFWFLIFSISFFSFLIWFLFFSQFFLLESLSSNEKEIENFLKAKPKENFLKKELNFIFLLNWGKIKKEILEKFPEIKDAKVKILGFKKFKVEVEKRKEVLNFCNTQKCFVLDEKGIAFKEEKNENLLQIEGKKEVSLKNEVFPEKLIQGILQVKNDFEKMGIKIEKMKIEEEKLEILVDKGYFVIFDPDKEITFQLKKFEISIKEIPPEKLEKLEYIDLRFSNFAIPKFKN
jgi:cell division septal protein FtsQ